MTLLKCCTQYTSKFGKLSNGHRIGNDQLHSNLKERKCQRMLKLPYNCAHFTGQLGNTQNSSCQALTVHELRASRCSIWIQKRQRDQRSNCQHLLDHRKNKGISENIYFCFIDYSKIFDCMDQNKLWKILKEMGIPDHLICLPRHLYTGQEASF